MRHLAEIRNDDLARDVLAERHRDRRLRVPEFIAFHDVTQQHGRGVLIRYFDADGGFAGNRRFDSHTRCRKRKRDIVGERCDAVDAHAGRGLQLIAGDDRTDGDIDDLCGNIEALQRFLEQVRDRRRILRALCERLARLVQAVDGRRLVSRRLRCGRYHDRKIVFVLRLGLFDRFLHRLRF